MKSLSLLQQASRLVTKTGCREIRQPVAIYKILLYLCFITGEKARQLSQTHGIMVEDGSDEK